MSRLEKSSAAGPLCCSPILYYEKNSKSKSVLVPVLNIGIKMVFEGTLGRKEKVMNDSLTRYFIKTKIKYSLLWHYFSIYLYFCCKSDWKEIYNSVHCKPKQSTSNWMCSQVEH